MPSLNPSLPGMPGRAAGLFPVASNQLPSVTVGGGGDFAAMVAPPEGDAPAESSGFLDAAPALPPGSGLPPIRQIIAGPPEPLPDIPVEDVMVGASTPAPAESAVPSKAVTPPPATSEAVMGECRIDDWDRHGASRRALAHASLPPAPAKQFAVPVQTPPDEVTGLAPASAEDDAPIPPDQAEGETAKAETPQPAPPLFAPIDWSRPSAPPPKPEGDGSGASEGTVEPLTFEASRMPARVDTPARPGPEAISTLPDQARDQPVPDAGQPKAAHQTPPADGRAQGQPQQPAVTNRAASLPGNVLPPEIAREIAEVVRAAGGTRDDSAPASESRDSAPLPPLQANIAGPAPALHRDFTAALRPVIDTTRAEWMQSMIERIAEMPQVDGKREAQIRLSPDALGTIDVRIEQRQDRLHVTMNADNPQARQLLAEAAPRLQDMAEARGLRLGQTGIGGGESHDRRPAQEQQEQNVPLRPRPAKAVADTSSLSDGDLIA